MALCDSLEILDIYTSANVTDTIVFDCFNFTDICCACASNVFQTSLNSAHPVVVGMI